MRLDPLIGLCSIVLVTGLAGVVLAQPLQSEPPPTVIQETAGDAGQTLRPGAAATGEQSSQAETRQKLIENAAAERARMLHPYQVNTAEKVMNRIQRRFTNQTVRWHPFLQNAYRGGGFAPGVGYTFHPTSYSTLDVRGSYSIRQYKLAEAELISPRLFDRQAELKILGGWRDATEVAFYGVGMGTTSGDRANYRFKQPFGSALVTYRPMRRFLLLRGGVELTKWDLQSGEGSLRSVDEVYTREELPGLGSATTYLHTQATAGFDSRRSSAYARRGGFYGVTAHDYTDRDDALGFRRVDYEVIQHIPLLRNTWIVSLHGLASTTWGKTDETVPFYLLPSLGGGSSLRGFGSFRFRDRHSLLLQAEWRIWGNRFFESAVFYDAGKVARRTSDLDLNGLKSDYGFGLRFHTPLATVFRLDVARSNEGTRLVLAASPVF